MGTDRKRRRGRTLIKAGAVAGTMIAFAPACGCVAPHIYVSDCMDPVNGSCTCPNYELNPQGVCVPPTTGTTTSGGTGTGGGITSGGTGGGTSSGGGDAG
jgi:uncharacterized membrane protein YgcG